jgi:hypothetical protein
MKWGPNIMLHVNNPYTVEANGRESWFKANLGQNVSLIQIKKWHKPQKKKKKAIPGFHTLTEKLPLRKLHTFSINFLLLLQQIMSNLVHKIDLLIYDSESWKS